MDINDNCPLAGTLAMRLRAAREELTARWLERIAVRVSLDRNELFPTEELLDHVPLLIDGIAAYMEDPADEIAGDVPVVAKAMELGEMRYKQGFDAYQISKEYELLGGVLFNFMARIVDDIAEPCSRQELLQCAHRVFHAVTLIQQFTMMHFLRKSGERIKEREDRLRAFNRTVSHELKNRVGAIKGAHALLAESWLDAAGRQRFLDMIGENVSGIETVLANLLALSGLDGDARQQRNVRLPAAVAEVVRQLRGSARARRVAVRVADGLPDVEVNAAAVELCLTNYLSNAIKYTDSTKADRWVEIRGQLVPRRGDEGGQELLVEVRDNGLGVPSEARDHLFERFYRAREAVVTGIEGTGLGLSIVRETVETLGGRAWIEPAGELGTTFAFALPLRRTVDRGETREVSPPRAVSSTRHSAEPMTPKQAD